MHPRDMCECMPLTYSVNSPKKGGDTCSQHKEDQLTVTNNMGQHCTRRFYTVTR